MRDAALELTSRRFPSGPSLDPWLVLDGDARARWLARSCKWLQKAGRRFDHRSGEQVPEPDDDWRLVRRVWCILSHVVT